MKPGGEAYREMTDYPEVGKKVVIGIVTGYLVNDSCFGLWNGEEWMLEHPLEWNGKIVALSGCRWREAVGGKMMLRHKYLLDTAVGCTHIWGFGGRSDESWLYRNQFKMREEMEFDVCDIFRYCPICGKKLILSENDNEVELIKESL